jgi:hypothetical protein
MRLSLMPRSEYVQFTHDGRLQTFGAGDRRHIMMPQHEKRKIKIEKKFLSIKPAHILLFDHAEFGLLASKRFSVLAFAYVLSIRNVEPR